MDNVIELPWQPNLIIAGMEWRSGESDTVGFVAVQNKESKYWQVFVGISNGIDPKKDAIYIAKTGAKLLPEEARPFFRYLPNDKYTLEELAKEKEE